MRDGPRFMFTGSPAAAAIAAKDNSGAKSTAESELHRGYDRTDGRALEIGHHDQILSRRRPLREEDAHATADRESPGRFAERIEQESSEDIHSTTVPIDRVAARDTGAAHELQSDVVAQRDIDSQSTLHGALVRRVRIDDVYPRFNWRQVGFVRALLRANADRRERE